MEAEVADVGVVEVVEAVKMDAEKMTMRSHEIGPESSATTATSMVITHQNAGIRRKKKRQTWPRWRRRRHHF